MYKVEFYQIKDGRWRWKMTFKGKAVVRAEHYYKTKDNCIRAYRSLISSIRKQDTFRPDNIHNMMEYDPQK